MTTFRAYKIFSANKNADGTVSNIAWPSNAVKNAVTGVIEKFTPSYSSANAQDAADYISDAYQNASGQLTTDQIAAAVDDTATSTTMTAGTATTLAEGYWLIVTDGNSVDTDEDVMSAGIDYDQDSYKVTIDGKDVTSSFTQPVRAQGGL